MVSERKKVGDKLDHWIRSNCLIRKKSVSAVSSGTFDVVMVEAVPWFESRKRLRLQAENYVWSHSNTRSKQILEQVIESIKKLHSERRSIFRHNDWVSSEVVGGWQTAISKSLTVNIDRNSPKPLCDSIEGCNHDTGTGPGSDHCEERAEYIHPLEFFGLPEKNPATKGSFDLHLDGMLKSFSDVVGGAIDSATTLTTYFLALPLPFPQPTTTAGGYGVVFIYCWSTSQWSPAHEGLVDDLGRVAALLFENEYIEAARRELRNNQRRAAIASILARNFSHVTGSHVISNPDFAMELAGNGVWEVWRRTLETQTAGFAKARRHWLSLGRDEPGATEHWRSGLLTLQQMLNVAEQTGGVLLEQTRRFHEYLQGRFDFIARAIDNTHDRQEPVFLVSDLLDGLLRQSAFLGTLVADLGVRLPNIEFVLHLGGGSQSEFRTKWKKVGSDLSPEKPVAPGWNPERWEHVWCDASGKPTQGIAKHEAMLGLPGGMIACHAFYALLENVIRNSVKYGSFRSSLTNLTGSKHEVKSYELHLRLSDDEKGRYSLRIWDNCSGIDDHNSEDGTSASNEEATHSALPKENSPHASIQSQIFEDILDEHGKQRDQGLGVQEMILCADSLLSQRARYELEQRNKSKSPDKQEKALRLVEREESEGESNRYLTYEVTLSKPAFVGIWVEDSDSDQGEGIVRRTCDLSQVVAGLKNGPSAGFSAQMLVIDGRLPIDDVIKTVSAHHGMLPYRTFVVCSEDRLGDWHKAIHNGETYRFLESDALESVLPPGRLRVVADGVLQRWLSEINLAQGESDEEEKQRFSIACYDAWLRAWKGKLQKDTPWDLWLGFELAESRVESTWKKLIERFASYRNDQVFARYQTKPRTLRVFARQGTRGDFPGPIFGPDQPESVSKYWASELETHYSRKRALVFDNHGVCFPEVLDAEKTTNPRESTRFYQKFGGETPDLYRLVANPPATSFGFAYFMYSLVESCLTNIAVLDERIAGDLLFAQGRADVVANRGEFDRQLSSHQKAGIYPLFTFKPLPRDEFLSDSRDLLVGMFSPMHHAALRKLLPYRKEGIPDLREEGIQFRREEDYKFLKKHKDITCERNRKERHRACTRADSLMVNKAGGFDLIQLVASCELDGELGGNAVEIDALIIHEGALDLMAGHQEVDWKNTMSAKLWKIAPWVVRTSGRGRATKHLRPWLPFIEFNEVSSAMLTSRNKYSLVRGLLGASGKDPDLQPPGNQASVE